jgi:c-di-GMP-related signal transduction protein
VGQTKAYTFAYQPILGADHSIVAMELLHRQIANYEPMIVDDTAATADVITCMFIHGEMEMLLGKRKAFVNIGKDLLMSDMIFMLPRDQVTIELLESIPINQQVVERCHKLKAMGFQIALDDFVGTRIDASSPLLEIADIVKIDLAQNELDTLQETADKLRQWPVKLLAEKVETIEDYEACRDIGFSFFQGYYFARPTQLSGKRPDPEKYTVLDLLSKLYRDADDPIIEDVLKLSPGLTFQLLRLANCAAFNPGKKIHSMRQAIIFLGRSQLTQWLQILLFAMGGAERVSSPLFEAAIKRGRLLDLMSNFPALSATRGAAHMVGMLSLADTLLGIPMEVILGQMGLVQEIEDALLHRTGMLGDMLLLCEALEQADFEKIEKIAGKLGIPLEQLMAWQKDALIWANRFTRYAYPEKHYA